MEETEGAEGVGEVVGEEIGGFVEGESEEGEEFCGEGLELCV